MKERMCEWKGECVNEIENVWMKGRMCEWKRDGRGDGKGRGDSELGRPEVAAAIVTAAALTWPPEWDQMAAAISAGEVAG